MGYLMRAHILKTGFVSGVLLCASMYAATVAASKEEPHSDPFKSCVSGECHAPIIQHKYLHGPLAVGQCTVCHAPLPGPDHKFRIMQKEADMCLTCHKRVDTEKFLHDPVAEGLCLKCHDPHGSASPSQIRISPVTRLCNDCHDPVATRKHTHKPVAEGDCLSCHGAHGSKAGKLLKASGSKLCFQCHDDMGPAAAGAKNKDIHLAKENCADCHRPHDSDYAGLLVRLPLDLCFGCHDDLKESIKSSEFKHEAVTEGQACIECHTAHNSRFPSLLRGQVSDLCFSCHDDLKAAIAAAKFKHRPVEDNACGSCHLPHGSRHSNLLFAELPPGTSASYDSAGYAFCFSCHKETIVRDRYTDDLTGFRNGSLNLHYLHVNKENNGRTCLNCHSGHAANQPKQIRDEAPYGSWKYTIRFTKNETGGSCATGCHEEYAYDRINPVQLKAR
jgi:predicted CXXCH cytochrome family protein